MRRGPILRLADDVYVEWVGSCDAPSYTYTRAEVVEMFDAEVREAEERLDIARSALERLDVQGHTYVDRDSTVEQIVAGNRAGPRESRLTFDQLVAQARAVLAGRDEP